MNDATGLRAYHLSSEADTEFGLLASLSTIRTDESSPYIVLHLPKWAIDHKATKVLLKRFFGGLNYQWWLHMDTDSDGGAITQVFIKANREHE